MNSKTLIRLAVIVGVFILVVTTCLFILEEGYQSITLRFGKIVNVSKEAGLHFKLPWDQVKIYSRKILSWDGMAKEIPTEQSEAQFIFVDATARWRIVDPQRFYEKLGSQTEALAKLDNLIDPAVRQVISNNLLLEAIRSTRETLDFKMLELENVSAIIEDLLSSQDRVSTYLRSSLSGEKLTMLKEMDSQDVLTPLQQEQFLGIFNDFIKDPGLYEPRRFANIQQIKHTKEILAKESITDEEKLILNRLLLESVYGKDMKILTIKKGRKELSTEMLEIARGNMIAQDETGKTVNNFGIELIDVVIRQIKYSDTLTASVYDRMKKERNRIASKIRAEGEAERRKIEGQASRYYANTYSQARANAEKIKGEGDQEATRIYAEAYGKDREFFRFWRTLESYKKVLPGFNKTLSTDAEYFDYLYNKDGQ